MSRARLIDIDAEPPPQTEDGEDFQKAIEEYKSYRTIHIRDEQHLQPETWEEKVEPARTQRQHWAHHSFNLMKEALKPKRCLSDIFSDAYRIPKRLEPYRRSIPVERSCGGCPVCREQGKSALPGENPKPLGIWDQPNYKLGDNLKKLMAGENLLGIFYPLPMERKSQRNRKRLISWLVKEGIINIFAPRELESLFHQQLVFLLENYQLFLMSKLPTLLYYGSGNIPLREYQQFTKAQLPQVVFLPDNALDPTTPHRLLRDVWPGRNFRLDLLCGELGL